MSRQVVQAERLSYSIGFSLPCDLATIQAKLATIPESFWELAYDADGQPGPGRLGRRGHRPVPAGLLASRDAADSPQEHPHPVVQLRITDLDGLRVTAFATNTTRGQLADLELRHRRRACCEDRIRCAKDTGLTNLPLHDFAQNQIL